MLQSTTWRARPEREIFITALLLAVPRQVKTPMKQLAPESLRETGWVLPPGDYGWCDTSGDGLLELAGVGLEPGLSALSRLGSPEPRSRSQEFEGRRLVRIAGGYVVLNYLKYRDKDITAAARSARYRERQRQQSRVIARGVTQAEAEAEADPDPTGGGRAKDGTGGVRARGTGAPPPPPAGETLQARAERVRRNPTEADWALPDAWPEVQAVAQALARANGRPALRLGSYARDSGVRAIVELYASGYTQTELERAVQAAVRSEWWMKSRRGLGALTPEVVRRALEDGALSPRVAKILAESEATNGRGE